MRKYFIKFFKILFFVKRFFQTIKYLKISQLFFTITGYLINIKISLEKLPFRTTKKLFLKDFCWRNENIKDKKFKFLNQTKVIKKPKDWNKKKASKLWLYNLHYFDYLNNKDNKKYKIRNRNFIHKWIKENDFKKGVGWDPYPTSLRIVNWIKWLIKNNIKDETIEKSLAVQLRWLNKNKEYRLMANHLLANAKALFFGGYFFCGKEAEEWIYEGNKILQNQLSEQILSDGGHFERSPMYHCIIIEDLIDIQNLIVSNKFIKENHLKKILNLKIKEMLYWLNKVKHPDGEIPFFNDSTLGIAPNEYDLKKYYQILNNHNLKYDQSDCFILKDSGYGVIKNKNIFCVCDIGSIKPDYMPGHSHAETLSFETSFNNKRFIVNSGVSVYGLGEKRIFQRSTKAHSTVEIDNKNSTDVWSGFRVGSRARVFNRNQKIDHEEKYVYAAHDGYMKLKGNPIHSRLWILKDNQLEVLDHINGSFMHTICIRYYLHPRCKIEKIYSNSLVVKRKYQNGFSKILIYWDSKFSLEIINSFWNCGFNKQIENKCLILQNRVDLPTINKTIFKVLE